MNPALLRLLTLVAAVSFLPGCGGGKPLPELGAVSGQVTLKGKPVEGAMVVFVPVERNAVPSSGQTGPDGKYAMHYKTGDAGVILGSHRVEITTGAAWKDESKPAPLPMTYAVAEEKTVASGDNHFDFDLSTLGKPRSGG